VLCITEYTAENIPEEPDADNAAVGRIRLLSYQLKVAEVPKMNSFLGLWYFPAGFGKDN